MVDATIELSMNERRDASLAQDTLRLASLLLHCHGFVILRGAIETSLVNDMKAAFDRILADCHASLAGTSLADIPWTSRAGTRFWIANGRLRAFIRLVDSFAHPHLVANPFAMQLLRELLGDDVYCNSVSSDVCLQGALMQSPHRDIGFYPTGETVGAIVNVPLMHCGLHNGPIEVWPGGSHLWRRDLFAKHEMKPFAQDLANPRLEDLIRYVPSRKLELYPGDVLVRDPGMLHRGTTNPTPEPRVMLTLGYFRAGYTYRFGDPSYSLDEAAFRALDPSVRRLVEYRYRSGVSYKLMYG